MHGAGLHLRRRTLFSGSGDSVLHVVVGLHVIIGQQPIISFFLCARIIEGVAVVTCVASDPTGTPIESQLYATHYIVYVSCH